MSEAGPALERDSNGERTALNGVTYRGFKGRRPCRERTCLTASAATGIRCGTVSTQTVEVLPSTKAAQETSSRFTAAQDYSPREAQEGPATEGETTTTTIAPEGTQRACGLQRRRWTNSGSAAEAAQEDLPALTRAPGWRSPRGSRGVQRQLVPVSTP